jgi:hypothetical protein
MSGHGCEFCGCDNRANHKAPVAVDETSEVLLSEAGDDREKPLRFDMHSHILPKQWPSLNEVSKQKRAFFLLSSSFLASSEPALFFARNMARAPGFTSSTTEMDMPTW